MATSTYTATIKLKSGTQKVTIQANDVFKAKEMLEAQYGKGCLFNGPTRS